MSNIDIDAVIVQVMNSKNALISHNKSTMASQPIPMVSFEDMSKLASIAQQQAQEIGIDIVFSLVDRYGMQRFYFSMPDALLVSHKLAFQKAYSAVAMRMATHKIKPFVTIDGELYGLTNNTDICVIGGGFSCWCQQQLIAGIGVSGGTAEQDMKIVLNTLQTFSQHNYLLIGR